MEKKERKRLIADIRRILVQEIGPSIPPSQDPMRGSNFDYAAKKVFELCEMRLK